MSSATVDRIAKALLYEGYMLYPYRASAVKNQQRFNWGVLYPRWYSAHQESEPWYSQAECVVLGDQSTIEVRVKFLHLLERTVYECVPAVLNSEVQHRAVNRLEVDGRVLQPWQEAIEREIRVPAVRVESLTHVQVEFPAELLPSCSEELIRNSRGETAATMARTQQRVDLMVRVGAHKDAAGAFKLRVGVSNLTEIPTSAAHREQALLYSAVSTHIVLSVTNGEFASLLDPPEGLRPLVQTCQNIGCFPVLVGTDGQRDTMLASPIILYDYPEIAPESAGDLFDATEIDEILSLRIMTLTDEEKQEVRGSDERARRILERTETLPQEEIMKLHGALRGMRPTQSERAP
jgi:hypothetical protein